jgi:ribonuclease D
MPEARMRPAIMVTSQNALHHMVLSLKKEPSIAVDTESNSLHAYRERVCLIQISIPGTDYLVDPFPIANMSELAEVFADPTIQKVFHAGDYDISTLKHDFGFEVRNVFDTMLAATALAEPAIGLAALLDKYYDIQLVKKYQRADWGKRPLDPDMRMYAQADSHYLLDLRDLLTKMLIEANRLQAVLEDSEAMARLTPAMQNHEEDVWRVKGALDLKPRALSLLKELNHFRELMAEAKDRPAFKVISDKALIEIATTQPRFVEELGLLPSFSPLLTRLYGNQIIQIVKNWQANPLPVEDRVNHNLSNRELTLRDKLVKWRKETGEKEGVPSNAVISRELLERLAHHDPQTEEEFAKVMQDYPYRLERYGEELFRIVKRKNK